MSRITCNLSDTPCHYVNRLKKKGLVGFAPNLSLEKMFYFLSHACALASNTNLHLYFISTTRSANKRLVLNEIFPKGAINSFLYIAFHCTLLLTLATVIFKLSRDSSVPRAKELLKWGYYIMLDAIYGAILSSGKAAYRLAMLFLSFFCDSKVPF